MTHLPSCLAPLIIRHMDPFYCWTVVRLTSKYWRSEIEKMFRSNARLELFIKTEIHTAHGYNIISEPAKYHHNDSSENVFCLQLFGYTRDPPRLEISSITSHSNPCNSRYHEGCIYVDQQQITSIWDGNAFVQVSTNQIQGNTTIWNVTISVKDWKTLFYPSCEICFNKAFGHNRDPLQLCLWCKHKITDEKWCNDSCKEEAEYYAIPVKYRKYEKTDLKKYMDSVGR